MKLFRRFRRSFTLVELMITLLVIGVLLFFAIPTYVNIKRKMEDTNAKTNLKLLQAAEKNYYVETKQYLACADPVACNTALGTDLPACSAADCATKNMWLYAVTLPDTGVGFDAKATSEKGTSDWHIDQDMAEAAAL
jgi:prepilin-type N-terminal cleavage/methylation domain-containing protein